MTALIWDQPNQEDPVGSELLGCSDRQVFLCCHLANYSSIREILQTVKLCVCVCVLGSLLNSIIDQEQSALSPLMGSLSDGG